MQDENKTVMMALSVFVLVYVLVYYLFFSFSDFGSSEVDEWDVDEAKVFTWQDEHIVSLDRFHEDQLEERLLDEKNDQDIIEDISDQEDESTKQEAKEDKESNEAKQDEKEGEQSYDDWDSQEKESKDESVSEKQKILDDLLDWKGLIRWNSMWYDKDIARSREALGVYTWWNLEALDEVLDTIEYAIEFQDWNYLYPLSYEWNIYEIIVSGIEILDFSEKNIIKDERNMFGQRLIELQRDDWKDDRVVYIVYIKDHDDYWYINIDGDQYDSDIKSSLREFFSAIYTDSEI